MFVVIYEHEITNGYLRLDSRKCVEHTINLDYLERMEYESNYPNGYGDYLPCLKLFIYEVSDFCGRCFPIVYREVFNKANDSMTVEEVRKRIRRNVEND